jgi:ketosteroid isomerase-like protein
MFRANNEFNPTGRVTMRPIAIAGATVLAVVTHFTPLLGAEDVVDVKAAEMAFNAAQNAGDTDGMFKYLLPDRTVYGSSGGPLGEGWTETSKKRRQAEFDAGRKIDLRIEDLKVRIYGDAAITTFYRIGTMKEAGGIPKQVHLRISGVWVRQKGEWKLAHRHESPF